MQTIVRAAFSAATLFCSLASLSIAAPALAAGSSEAPLVAAAAATTAATTPSLLLAAQPAPAGPTAANLLTLGPPAPQAAIVATPATADAQPAAAPAANGSLSDLVHAKLATDTEGDEHACLAATVYFESKGQPYNGQLAVAQTILNRTRSGRFPATVCGVVKQPHQFGFIRHGEIPSIAHVGQQWREAVAIASIALKDAWKTVAERALYFNTGRSPAPGLIRVAQIGAQAFYR